MNMDSNKHNEKRSFKERLSASGKKGFIRAGIWCALYILFVVWVSWNHWQSLAWLLLLPVIAAIFTTKYIPWTWWKQIKNPGHHDGSREI